MVNFEQTPPEIPQSVKINASRLPGFGNRSDLYLVSRIKESFEGRQSLEKADKIVVGGAGLGNIDGFRKIRKLAAALGAQVGAMSMRWMRLYCQSPILNF